MIFEHEDILSHIIYHLDYLSIRRLSKTCNYLQNKMPEIISTSLAISNFFSVPSPFSIEWYLNEGASLSQNHKNLAIAAGDAYSIFFSNEKTSRADSDCDFSLQNDDQDESNDLETVFNCL